jgi:hypothetical protein
MVMTLFNALDILELDGDFTIEDLKRQYRIKALMYHPDKNPRIESSALFMEIQDSYEFLKRYRSDQTWWSDDIEGGSGWGQDHGPIPKYKNILFSFLQGILAIDNNQVLFHTILERVVNSCEEKALKMLETLDITILKKIYDILKKYKEVLHFDDEFFEKIENIWVSRTYKNEYIVLNPTIDDLFQDKIYRLKMGEFQYFVPLWHHELVYDQSGVDVTVKCNPILSENIEIDEKNDVMVSVTMKIADIWDMEKIPIKIGSRVFTIERGLLKFVPIQRFVIFKDGIPKINTKNVYDVSERADLIIIIYLSI